MRRRVLLSCLQLKDDNGGIVLDISEQGLAVQAARNLGDEEYIQLRFQLSQSDYWIETHGRIAWISVSKQTAGVEFIGLSYESFMFIKTWISSIACQHGSEDIIPGAVSPPKSLFILDETAAVTSNPETAKTDVLVEEFIQALLAEELASVFHPVASKNDGGGSGNAIGENECRTPAENISTNGFELTPYPQSVGPNGPPTKRDLRSVTSKSIRYVGLLVGAALLLSFFISLDHSLRKAANGPPKQQATSSEKLSPAPSGSSMSSMIAPRKAGVSSDAGFILQVAAVEEERRAISFADLLRQRGFPSYVYKPAASKLYRVLVGPYGDVDSAAKVEDELRKHGFDAIRRKNTLAQ